METKTLLTRRDVRQALYLGNACWHTAAVYYFLFKARGIIRKASTAKADQPFARDIMNFLGALNSGYAILAILRLIRIARASPKGAASDRAEDQLALLTLGTANVSQFILDLMAAKWFEKRWPGLGGLDIITICDGIFTFCDFGWVLFA